ncbi:hypothetical protein [Cupriavidus pauculus]|uniref:hypothetical protein n=1 Tax=Cupriavidus pauculus TaxID=82633 RepID=UPI0038576286
MTLETLSAADAAPKPGVAPFDSWLQRLAAAEAARDTARQAVAEDRRQRTTLRAKLWACLAGTRAEAELRKADDHMAALTDDAHAAVRLWVNDTAAAWIEQEAPEPHGSQLRRVAAVGARFEQLQSWQALARSAVQALERAESHCRSASTSEFFDAISKSKVMSVMSSLDTSAARNAVATARSATQALQQALPKRGATAQLDLPDDTLDLIVDVCLDPGFDILSLFNMAALDKSAAQCNRLRHVLSPLVARLDQLTTAAHQVAQRETARLQAIQAPFLQRAAELVPAPIRLPAPKQLPATPRPGR